MLENSQSLTVMSSELVTLIALSEPHLYPSLPSLLEWWIFSPDISMNCGGGFLPF